MKQKHKSILYQAVFFFLCLAIGAFIGAVFARSAKSGMQIIPLRILDLYSGIIHFANYYS